MPFEEDFTKIGFKPLSPPKRDPAKSIRNGEYFIFNEVKNPILFLLLDLGVNALATPTVQVSVSKQRVPHIWAIHSRGHGENVFGCLTRMKCGENRYSHSICNVWVIAIWCNQSSLRCSDPNRGPPTVRV